MIAKAEIGKVQFEKKPHFLLLDALRGVAALLVLWYHIYECFPLEHQWFNHGYLAVDFFFILSGFVIGYAYDDRWKKGLTAGRFIKRRLVRLHPMVIAGVLIGTVTFLIQGGVQWDGSKVPLSMLMIAVLLNLFLIPNIPGALFEVRGNGEMFPLNGPSWSLFFEYIANIFYFLVLRRFTTVVLAIFTALAGAGYIWYAIADVAEYGSMGVGWTLADGNLIGGLLRVGFAFPMGMLLSRVFKPHKIKRAFLWCTFILVGFMAVPFISVNDSTLWNRLFDAFCVICIFPLVVLLGASGTAGGKRSETMCTFLGNISYPLYIVHYPFMYLFYAYIGFPDTFRTPAETWPLHILLFFGSIFIAWIFWKFYDRPLRNRLSSKFTKL